MPADASDSADAAPGAAEDMATDPLALANQLCFSLSVASRMVVQSYRPVLEPLGLTHPQYLVMLALWGSAPRTVKDLGEQLRQDPATLSPLLKRLEARGYVTRGRDPQNERALAVSLTRGGLALRERAREVPLRMMERLRITESQVHALNEQMHRLIGNAQDLGQDHPHD
ncbi:MarR family transcriptional regulator [Kocuria varians]|uniref:MarR family transcriptional regulator n=1 Tax=Kocuria varians TaxID=1272 RepID=A0A4Y4D3P8_KOCVA|nr:MarR family transcriptional regulator [Kocuria varians]